MYFWFLEGAVDQGGELSQKELSQKELSQKELSQKELFCVLRVTTRVAQQVAGSYCAFILSCQVSLLQNNKLFFCADFTSEDCSYANNGDRPRCRRPFWASLRFASQQHYHTAGPDRVAREVAGCERNKKQRPDLVGLKKRVAKCRVVVRFQRLCAAVTVPRAFCKTTELSRQLKCPSTHLALPIRDTENSGLPPYSTSSLPYARYSHQQQWNSRIVFPGKLARKLRVNQVNTGPIDIYGGLTQ